MVGFGWRVVHLTLDKPRVSHTLRSRPSDSLSTASHRHSTLALTGALTPTSVRTN